MSIGKESRLLQHTASSYVKARDAALSPRNTLLFSSPRGSSPGCGTSTPPRSNSPGRRLEESYNKHFRGSTMSVILTGTVPCDRTSRGGSPAPVRAPSTSSTAGGDMDQASLRTVRRQMDHPNQVSVVTFSKEDRLLASVSSLRSDASSSIGLWVKSPINNAHNMTGSKKHFGESPPAVSSDEVLRGRRHADVPTDLRGSAALVAETSAAVSAETTPSRSVKPFVRTVPYSLDSEPTPPSNAPNVATPPTGRRRIVAGDHPDLTTHSTELCTDRERRMMAPVPGKSNDSHNVINLANDPTVSLPKQSSIRTLDGPPAFVPESLPPRRASPSRFNAEYHSKSTISFASHSSQQQALVVGRGVGLYSPLRQRSELRLA